MKHTFVLFLAIVLSMGMSLTAMPDEPNKVRYVPYTPDPVLEQIREHFMALEKQRHEETRKIQQQHQKEKTEQRKQRRNMKSDFSGVHPPASTEAFNQFFHFPPQAQYMTSTCWSFCTTSFYESEINRLTGKKIKLSEMWTPYWELLAKCRRYIRERGNSYVAGGGEANAFQRIWKEHGVVPAEAYTGVLNEGDKHNHGPLMKELESYLEYIKENGLWNEQENIRHITLILNRHMGTPPEQFTWQGRKMTPHEFLKITGLNMDDYVSTMSTSYYPFHTFQEFRAPDNWWHSKDYLNLPLDEWISVIRRAMKNGYTVNIGGDTSEPGKCGERDIAFVPSFDIPPDWINQDSREFRIYNRTTGDDHGIHMVGHVDLDGWNWYLIKDSGRSARKGQFDGYYMFREDYIKLKMLTFTVHKDMLKHIQDKMNP
ncbi:MAG: peptidase C1 [Candidatus Aminicenantes bacterium]|nr:peptidase C1 [Candidatus Aminicenantes bacterium]